MHKMLNGIKKTKIKRMECFVLSFVDPFQNASLITFVFHLSSVFRTFLRKRLTITRWCDCVLVNFVSNYFFLSLEALQSDAISEFSLSFTPRCPRLRFTSRINTNTLETFIYKKRANYDLKK